MKYFYSLSLFLLTFNILMGQPSNNTCSSSTAILLTPVSNATNANAVSCNTQGATQSYPPTTCDNIISTHGNDVFFKFNATQSSYVIRVDPSSGYDPAVFVYQGSCTGQEVGCSDNGGGNGQVEEVPLNGLNIGTTYYVKVHDYDNSAATITNSYTFEIWVIAPNMSGAADISFSPSSLSFGNVQVNNSNSQTVDIINNGTSDLLVSGITYPNGFTGASSLPVISAGGTYSLNVNFNPTSSSNYSGNINFNSNASSSPDQISVSGTGTNSNAAQISVTPTSLFYGSVQIGATSPTQAIVITNTGNSTLTINSITSPYPLTYTGAWSGNILPGNSQTVNFAFSPSAAIAYNGNIQISSSAGNVNVAVAGNGTNGIPTIITGSVKDVGVDYAHNTVLYNPLAGKTVNLKTSTGTIINSTTTDNNGNFSFSGVGSNNYKIEVLSNDSYGQFSVTKSSITAGANPIFYVPRNITNQIRVLLTSLGSLKVTVTEDGGSFISNQDVDSYSTSSSSALLNTYSTSTDNDTRIKTALTRMYLAELTLLRMYEEAAKTGNETTISIAGFFDIVSYALSLKEKLEPALPILSNLIDGAVSTLVWLYKITSSQNDPNASAFILLSKSQLEYDLSIDPADVLDIISDPVKRIIQVHGTPLLTKLFYVNPTRPVFSSVGNQASINTNYLSPINTAIYNTKNEINLGIAQTQTSINSISDYRAISNFASDVGTLSTAVSPLLAYSGFPPLAAAAPIVYSVGQILNGFAYIPLAISTRKGFQNLKYLRNDLGTKITLGAYSRPSQIAMPYLNDDYIDVGQSLNDAVNDYNNALSDIINDVDYSHEGTAYTKINNLVMADNNLTQSFKEGLYPILAAYPQLETAYPNFETNYYDNQLMAPLFDNAAKRLELSMSLLSLFCDTTVYSTNTSIVALSNDIINSNNTVRTTINQFNNLVVGMNLPAYPAVINEQYQVRMLKNTTQEVKVVFKNYGNTPITNAYCKIELESGFTTNSDSIFIGTINANQVDSTIFVVSSPNIDTLGGYRWILYGDNTSGAGTGGALATVDDLNPLIVVPRISNNVNVKIAPNPADNNIAFNFDRKCNGEIQIIDMYGRTIIDDVLNNTSVYIYDTTNIGNGIYTVLVKNENTISNSKFIINHK